MNPADPLELAEQIRSLHRFGRAVAEQLCRRDLIDFGDIDLDRGRVVETGAHAEFVTRNGLYARLIRRQLGAREAAAADGE